MLIAHLCKMSFTVTVGAYIQLASVKGAKLYAQFSGHC